MNKILLTFFIFGSLINITNSYFCDGYNEYDSLCASGNTIELIDNLDYFNSSYQNNINGYFGNKYNYSISTELWSSIGFLGTNRNYKTPTYFYAPLGFMFLYDNQNLVPDSQEDENNFSNYPLVTYEEENEVIDSLDEEEEIEETEEIEIENNDLPNPEEDDIDQSIVDNETEKITKTSSLYFNTKITCNPPKIITKTNIEIKNNGLLDYIHLSWDNSGKEKTKIIRISPENKEFFVEDGKNYYDDYDMKIGNYLYFIVVYNDCYQNGLYSDIITINYLGKEILSKLYLSLVKYELTLNIPKTIELDSFTKVNLKCRDNQKEILDENMINNKYIINKELIYNTFFCQASFFDKNGVYQKSELFVNNWIKDNYIKEKQALDYIYVGDSSNLLFNSLYLNISKFESGAYLTYGKSSLYLVNVLAKTYISSEMLSFDALKKYGYIGPNALVQEKVTETDFINLLMFIEKDLVKFQKNIYNYIDGNYGNKKYNLVINDVNQNINLINKLKSYENKDRQKYNNLLECISTITCKDVSLLNGISDDGLQQSIDIDIYKDYMKTLYFNLGYESYKNNLYSQDDYNKFIDIIVESISYGNSFYDNKISYESFRNLQYEILLHAKLQENISYLVEKHLEKILLIYNTSSKEDMIWLLRDFLAR